MSEGKYVTPTEMLILAGEGKVKTLCFSVGDSKKEQAEELINKLRNINKKDAGFCYTCKCNDTKTAWTFGYTDPKIYEEADKLSDEIIAEIRTARGLDPEGMSFGIGVGSPCSCPFAGE